MHILIEEHQYPVERVKPILSGLYTPSDIEKTVQVKYVGYYFNPTLNDCVFILPKVLLDENDKAFGKYNPEDLIDLEENEKLEENRRLKEEEKEFIYNLSVWIYRSIAVYNELNSPNDNVLNGNLTELGKGRLRVCRTYLDILLAIQKFNHENQNFFFFILKNLHSGFNKINWVKTISHSQAFIQNNSPVYLNPVNKKRKINFDEELLIIFFSILNYMHEHFGFPVEINVNFPLITGKVFDNYLKGFGKTRLRQIKYKYFSDKALYLWELCYAFFDYENEKKVHVSDKDFLVVKKYDRVFESIIDELVGTKKDDIPKGLIEQDDGKRVDHMYFDKELIENDEYKPVYYIGDSKYYKRGTKVGKNSIYKQFTYAKNVIQWNLNLFLDEDDNDKDLIEDKKNFKDSGRVKKLRDEETEGYNIIPNFFISARQDTLKADSEITPTAKDDKVFSSRHFHNRLFDRDTLLVSHYDVNFLYVVSLYAKKNEGLKSAWRTKAKSMFREQIQNMLNEHFQFHVMTAREHIDGQEVLQQNFKEILGKIFTPYPDGVNGQKFYSLALEKPESIADESIRKKVIEENKRIIDLLTPHFEILECELGKDKRAELKTPPPDGIVYAKEEELALLITKEGIHFDNAIKKLGETKKVGVALKMDGATLRLVEGFTKVRYLIIHNKSDRYESFYLDDKGPKLVPKSKVEPMVMTKQEEDLYLVYQVDLSVKLYVGELDFSAVTKGGDSYSPKLMPLKNILIQYPLPFSDDGGETIND